MIAVLFAAVASACATGIEPMRDEGPNGAPGGSVGDAASGGSSGVGGASGGGSGSGAGSGGASGVGGASGGASGSSGSENGSGGSASSTGGTGSGSGGAGGVSASGGGAGLGGSGGSSAGTGGSAGTLHGGAGGGPTTDDLEVHYRRGDSDARDNQLRIHLDIVNGSADTVPLSEITVRYWYTVDSAASQEASVDYAAIGGGNIIRSFVAVTPAVSGADFYVELSFTAEAGSLAAGGRTGEIQLRLHKTDYSPFDERDDWSFVESASHTSSFGINEHVTLYRDGVLVWGTEPA